MEGMTPLVACDAAVMNPAKIESCDKLARHYHKDPKKLSADLKERYAGLDLSTPCLSLLVYAVECTPEGRKNKQAAAELSRRARGGRPLRRQRARRRTCARARDGARMEARHDYIGGGGCIKR